MPRILILLSLLPIIATLLMRWWLGIRVLSSAGRRPCTCHRDRWETILGSAHAPASDRAEAQVFAQALRKSALDRWKQESPKTYQSRQGVRRFGMAVPPLSLMVVLLGVMVGRVPVLWILPVFLMALALSAAFSYLGLAPELKASLAAASRIRESRCFPRRDDEDAVIAATTALAWKEAAPPLFNLIQR